MCNSVLRSQREIKEDLYIYDDICEFNASKKLKRVEIKKESKEKKMSVLDLYNIMQTRAKKIKDEKFEEEMRKLLSESEITY